MPILRMMCQWGEGYYERMCNYESELNVKWDNKCKVINTTV
jgi:hypothetical protein